MINRVWSLLGLRRRSLAKRIGLVQRDIILEINGVEIDRVADLLLYCPQERPRQLAFYDQARKKYSFHEPWPTSPPMSSSTSPIISHDNDD